MRHFKYIMFIVLLLTITSERTYADGIVSNVETCYYSDAAFKAKLYVYTNKFTLINQHNDDFTDVYINKIGNSVENNHEDVNNWVGGFFNNWGKHGTTSGGDYEVKFDDLYESRSDANENGTCPKYLVFQYCSVYRVWGTNDANQAQNAVNAIRTDDDCKAYFATYLNSDGKTKITEEEYYRSFVNPQTDGEKTEIDCNSFFGDVKDEGIKTDDGTVIKPASIAYLINSALTYVRIIVPILIILLGTIDLAKAVVASKEDQIKKAQSDFMKRIAMGVVVFFVPTLVNLVMKLADMVWVGLGYSSCPLP